MFKGLSNFAKSKNGMWVLVIIVVLFAIWVLMSYSKTKSSISDSMTGNSMSNNYSESSYSGAASVSAVDNASTVGNVSQNTMQQPAAAPADLLPKDNNAILWGNSYNPMGDQNPNPVVVDLMSAGALYGLKTVGSAHKNSNLQLRSDPTIPKQDVGPWNNSTIVADLGRVPLELGCN
jgi:hypothetical protein